MLSAEFLEAIHAGVDDIQAGGVGEADGEVGTESEPWDGGDFLLAEEFFAEVDGFDAHGLDIHEEVESAEGFDDGDVLDVLQAAHHELAADIKFIPHVGDDLLIALEGGDGAELSEGGGVGGGVALQDIDGVSDGLRGGGVAEAPAGHGVGFGESVDGDGEVGDILAEGGDGDVGVVAIHEFFIDLVREDEDVLTHGDVSEGLELFSGIDGSGGVAGGVDDDHLGEGGHGVLELIWGDLPVVFFFGFDDDGDAADETDHFRVAGPEGSGDDDFVTGVDGGGDGVVTGVFGAAVDADLFGGVLKAVVEVEFGGEGLAEFEEAGALGVAGLAVVEGLNGGLDDVGGGIEVGLTSAEAENIDTLFFERFGRSGNG